VTALTAMARVRLVLHRLLESMYLDALEQLG
jgi:hypothetical protein